MHRPTAFALFALTLAGGTSASCAAKDSAPSEAAAPAPAKSVADDRSWARVDLESVEGSLVKPSTDFGGRIEFPASWSYGAMTQGVPIVMTPDEIIFDARFIAPLKNGGIAPAELDEYLIRDLEPPLKAALADLQKQTDDADARQLVLFADRRVQMQALIPVIYTAGVAGFGSYELAIDVGLREGVEVPVGLVLPFLPPKVDTNAPGLSALIDQERVVLWLDEIPSAQVNLTFDQDSDDDIGHLATLALTRSQMLTQLGKFPSLKFTAEQDVTIGRLVAVVSALRGPKCEPNVLEDQTKCLFPLPVIQASNAPPKAELGPPLAKLGQCRSLALRLETTAQPRRNGKGEGSDAMTKAGQKFFASCLEIVHQPDVPCFEAATDRKSWSRCFEQAVKR